MKYPEMAGKTWGNLNAFLVILILSAYRINVSCVNAEFSSSRTLNITNLQMIQNIEIEKYKCEHENSEGRGSTTSHSSGHHSTNGIKLSCSDSHVVFKNITADEFVRGIGNNENGAIELFSRKFEHREYCVRDRNGPATVRIALCDEHVQQRYDNANTSVSSASMTLKKCCPSTQKLVKVAENGKERFSCVKADIYWKPAIFNSTNDDFSMHKDLDKFANITITDGFPECDGSQNSLDNSKDIWFMILESGSVEIGLKFWFKPVWLPVQDSEFCLDELLLDHDPSLHNETKFDSHAIYHKNQVLLYCQLERFDDYLFHRRLFGGMCIAAAAVVFILLVIYVAIWDRQNLAGWTQFNIFVALFFVVLMEGVRTLADANALLVRSTSTCVIIASIAQFFFFAMNTTWSVMCFDLFYMFWKLETTSKTVARYRNRLIGYLLFSWGIPLVVVCIAFYFNHYTATEEMGEMKGVYAFAHRRCSSPIRKLGFQTQGIMFLLNLIFFLLTTLLIWKHRRGLNAARKKSRNERHTWRSVCLFVKLVVVMGVSSLSIPVDYFFVSSTPLSATAICFRMIHFLPFFAVLFIFGFNEKNMILISQKYPKVGKYFGFVACTSGATASDTANHSRSVNRISDHPSSPT